MSLFKTRYLRAMAVAAGLLGTLAPVLPRRLRISPADEVARFLLDGAIAGPEGTHIVEAGRLA